MLKKHHPLWMSIHFTHPAELTPEVTEATARLADAGIPLGSQTVLLKGINDDAAVMKPLMHGLLKRRVKPYYLYQCDPIRGSAHFRTGVDKGLEIIQALRGHTTGYATPHVRDRCAGRRRQDPAGARSGGRAATATTCCCAISKARSTAIPIPADAGHWQARFPLGSGHLEPCASGSPMTCAAIISRPGLWRGRDRRIRRRGNHRRHLRGAGGLGSRARAHRRHQAFGGAAGGGRALGRRVQYLRGAQRRVARGPGARAAGSL